MHQTNNFSGQSGFYHAFGIVEDRIDPEKLGRLRVRWFGIHTDDKTQLPTDHLPWAQVILPISGTPGAVPNVWEGDMVFGFFADGAELQIPVILGTVSTNRGGGDPLKGFTDPREKATVTLPGQPNVPYSKRTEAPGVNPMSSGAGYAKKTATTATSVGGKSFSEPANPYKAVYPYNHVEMSESGHAVEIDDSPGAERIHVYHRSGSFVEFRPDGSIVAKSIKNDHHIILGDSFQYTKGKSSISADGTTDMYSGGAYSVEVKAGNMKVDVKSGDLNITVNGNVKLDATQKVDVTAGGVCSITAPKVDVTAGGVCSITAPMVKING